MSPTGDTPAARAHSADPADRLARRELARRRQRWERRRFVLALMAPASIGFVVFIAYPMVATLLLSFTHYDGLSTPRWIGMSNYRYLLDQDRQIDIAVRNTLWIIVVGVPVNVLFGMGVAHLLTKARRGSGVFRTLYYLPALTPPVAATLGFVYLLNPGVGPVNKFLDWLRLSPPLWFNDPQWAKPALVLLGMWGAGQIMIIFLASLLDVPAELYEAAALDGANGWQRFRYVTLPTISPVILFATVIGIVDGLQYFTEAYVASTIASGGDTVIGGANLGYPGGATLFYPIWLYQQGFRYFNMGYASAMAVVLFLVALGFIVVLVRRSMRSIHVESAGRS